MTLKEKLAYQKKVNHIKNEILNYEEIVDRNNYFSKYGEKRILVLNAQLEKLTRD